MVDHLLDIDWKKFEKTIQKQINDPFCFFQIEYLFEVNEVEIRRKYFEICSYYSTDKNILSQAHQMYLLILNPLKRLDIIIERHLLKNKCDEKNLIDDIDIGNEYSEWLDKKLNAKQLSEYRAQIQTNIINLYHDINEVWKNKQFHKLIVYRKKLSYLLNIKKMLWSREE